MAKALQGKVALVTGGSRGIGKAIALALADAGADVAIGSIDEEDLPKAAEEIRAKGVRSEWFFADVSVAEQADELVKSAAERLGRLDILVNNAGITRDGLLARMSEADWDRVMSINLKSAFLCSKAASRIMAKQRWGRIINISSVIGLLGNTGQANYAASKAGMIGLMKSLAREYASRSVTANAIAPGYIDTEMTEALPDKVKEQILKMIPLGTMGSPQDVANAVVFLSGEGARYITGQVIAVDGGMT